MSDIMKRWRSDTPCHALTVSESNGKTYWQNPHDTKEEAKDHALKYRKNDGYIFIFKEKFLREASSDGELDTLQSVYLSDLGIWWSMEGIYIDVHKDREVTW